LERVRVRLATPREEKRFKRLMARHHYLGWGKPVGETLQYVAEVDGHWVALLTFGAPAYALRDRDAWIGWTQAQRCARLNFLAQNRRFLVLPGVNEPNLASRVLGLCAQRIVADWEAAHGHPVLALETFVDPQRFMGTCYRAAGWEPLGLTAGARRVRRDWYDDEGTPKQLFVKPLVAQACAQLRAETWPEAWQPHVLPVRPMHVLRGDEHYSLFQAFLNLPDVRSAHGRRHRQASVLACAACAFLAGVEGIGEMAEFVAALDQRQLRALRCWYDRRTNRYLAPSESTLRRVLGGVDATWFDAVVAAWVRQHERLVALAIDGKTLRACRDALGRPRTLVAAVAHDSGAPVAQMVVAAGTNETATARDLLDILPPVDGAMLSFDAAHANGATARKVVIDKGADYLVPIKGNQPNLHAHAERLLPQAAFSPSDGHGREDARPCRDA
jgi:hypothetical protein